MSGAIHSRGKTLMDSIDSAGFSNLQAFSSVSSPHPHKRNSNLVLERNPTHAGRDSKWDKNHVTAYFQKMYGIERLLK